MIIRPMTEDDLDAGAALSRIAGWNQRREDWAFLYRCNPDGCFVACHEGKVVGTVTTLDYGGKVSWIGMVLVDPSMRRRGAGTLLLRTALDALAGCESIKLDATPAGKRVYDTLGFVEEYRFARMTAGRVPEPDETPPWARPMADADLDAVVALDRDVFGVERRCVVEGLRAMAPEYAVVAEDEANGVTGFALGRHGHDFEQVGPIVAPDVQTAKALAWAVFGRLTGKAALVDALQHTPAWTEWLQSLSFTEQRPYIRMYRGENPYPGHPKRTFAIAGPELG